MCFSLPFAGLAALAGRQPDGEWQNLAAWPGGATVQQIQTAASGQGQVIYAAGAVSGLFASANQGQSWLRLDLSGSDNPLGITRITSLAINPVKPQELYAVIATSKLRLRPMVYWSQDGGQSWEVRGSLGPRRIKAAAYGPRSNELFLVGGNGVFQAMLTVNNQLCFIRDQQDLEAAPGFALDGKMQVTELAVTGFPTSQAPTLIFYIATAGQGLQVFAGSAAVGFAAQPVAADSDSEYVRRHADITSLCYLPTNTAVVCVGTTRGIYASTDGGSSWFRSAQALKSEQATALLFDPVDNAIYVGLAGDGVYYSLDQGMQWRSLGRGLGSVTPFHLALSEGEPRYLFAATDKGVWRVSLDR